MVYPIPHSNLDIGFLVGRLLPSMLSTANSRLFMLSLVMQECPEMESLVI